MVPTFLGTHKKVPLNHSEPEGKSAAIALVRLPAAVGPQSTEYRGPILFNPGGPGGSGVELILAEGRDLSSIVGPQFDLVGFDPRGVGRSEPRVSFYETAVERELWQLQATHELEHSNHDLADTWGRALVTSRLASERDNDVLGHINTDQTARDMLKITEAHGYEKLKYWGFSYGTILGATFAAIFPDKVERLILDGVVDTNDYYSTAWATNLRDTSKVLQYFFDACSFVGPSKCAFHAETPAQIEKNLIDLYHSLKTHPVPVRTADSYGLVDYASLRYTIFRSFYAPWASFPRLAEGLADLAKGNGTKLFMMQEKDRFECSCAGRTDDYVFGKFGQDAETAILCNDGIPIPGTYEDTVEWYEEALEFSEWSSVWAGIRISCSGWKHASTQHFRGPIEGNTSFPLMFIGNTADPVTPLAAAHKMSKAFPGSVVLQQHSPGHCSVTAPSPCTQAHVRAYFVNGTLPKPDTWCYTVGNPFTNHTVPELLSVSDTALNTQMSFSTGENDQDLLAAVIRLSTRSTRQLPNAPLQF
ncbi:hypothetical protein D9758_004550 [Tetrapyrgos nigripes]|uniref:Uncharacterized protein n=1 Tax=Tetrapyrgos nigripes TaxID=182062 RepID=A0A8H5H0C0_9AGAR|nr:hypothetical protein D9758_004550 [Tetrapyrgos nigripes]